MFRPRAMQQVEILLLRRDLTRLLRTLAEARIIHLDRFEGGRDDEPAPEAASRLAGYRNFLTGARQLMDELGLDPQGGRLVRIDDFPAWQARLEDQRKTLEGLHRRLRENRRRRLRLLAFIQLVRQAGGTETACRQLTDLHLTTLELGLLPRSARDLAGTLPELSRIYPLTRIGRQNLVVALGLRRQQGTLDEALGTLGFQPLRRFRNLRGDCGEIRQRMARLLRRLRARRSHLRQRIRTLSADWAAELRERLASVAVEVHLLREQQEFGFTRLTVAMGGWVPKARLAELRRLLRETCGQRFQLRETAASSDATPVLILNPPPLRSFQRILAVLGTPGYREVEPTPLLAGGFLLMFGLMFGDLGHGLVLLLTGLLLRWKTRWADIGVIMAGVGAVAMLFGLLFGSCFGWEGLIAPLWFSPMHHIPRLMAVSVALGAMLILGGMLLRIINGLGREPLAEVLTDRFGVAGMAFYFSCLALGFLVFRHLLPPAVLLLVLLPLAAVFFHPLARAREEDGSRALLCAEGAVEMLETVLGLLANTFSFLRLAAFGLAHVGLSMAVFALADLVLPLPLGTLLAGAVHLVGNLVILALEGLVVSIQAVRLEFYEFFGKFFHGGGVPFTPLALNPATERKS